MSDAPTSRCGMEPHFVLGLFLFVAALGCGGSGGGVAPAGAAVESVAITASRATLTAIGDTIRCIAVVRSSSGDVLDGVPVTWTSSMAGVATVSATGLVTAVANGVALIRATAQGVVSGPLTITVSISGGSGPGQIVFTSGPSASTSRDLYLMNADGTGRVALTNFPPRQGGRVNLDAGRANWSPDGGRLVLETFVDSFAADFFALSLLNADGSGFQRLPVRGLHPSWSPDGTRIAFMALEVGYDLFVMNANGSNVVNITRTPNVEESDPAWSPDGQKIAFVAGTSTGSALYLMNPDGTGRQPITAFDQVVKYEPAWSPDGTQLAFVQWPGGSLSNRDIWIMNANGTGLRRLSLAQGTERSPSWSPDGTRLVFITNRDLIVPEVHGQYNHVWSIAVDGTGLTQLTSGYSTNEGPRWRP